jgi:hypothetical protein
MDLLPPGDPVAIARDTVLDLDSTYVSGPFNAVRLEGKVNGIKKVGHFFMDVHYHQMEQNICSNIGSTDFAEFFVKIFKSMPKSDRMYDFFVEVYPSYPGNFSIRKLNDNYVEPDTMHIDKVVRLFSKLFLMERETDTVKKSDVFPNLRLHYFDVRDYFNNVARDIVFFLMNTASKEIKIDSNDTNPTMTPIEKNDLKSSLQKMLEAIEKIIPVLQNPVKSPKKHPIIRHDFALDEKSALENVNRLAYKIRNSYANPNVKGPVVEMFDFGIEGLMQLVRSIESLIKNIVDDATDSEIIEQIEIILERYFWIYASLVDAFFLRRFLDKNYITNTIVYAGGNHVIRDIYLLVKFFDFKITHLAYDPKKYGIEKINQLVKKTGSAYKIRELFYDLSKQTGQEAQCSRLDSFPKNFL